MLLAELSGGGGLGRVRRGLWTLGTVCGQYTYFELRLLIANFAQDSQPGSDSNITSCDINYRAAVSLLIEHLSKYSRLI